MRPTRRLVAPLLAVALLLASALPCPPRGAVSAARGAHALEGEEDAAPPLELTRTCPCGCKDHHAPGSAGAQLGFAVARAPEPEAAPRIQPFVAAAARAMPVAPAHVDFVPV